MAPGAESAPVGELAGSFGWLDWSVVAAVLLGTTWVETQEAAVQQKQPHGDTDRVTGEVREVRHAAVTGQIED